MLHNRYNASMGGVAPKGVGMGARNPRIDTNNWRAAMVLLSQDIKAKGFAIDMKTSRARTMSDSELFDLVDTDPVPTGNDIADNVIYRFHSSHPKNPESTKLWRGDIEACYAKAKKQIYICLRMAMVSDPSLFGIEDDVWADASAGRRTSLNQLDFDILMEAFRCKTDYDAGYLFQRIKYVIDPNPVSGVVGVPLCQFRFSN